MENASSLNCSLVLADKAGEPPLHSFAVRCIISLILILFPVITISGNALVIIAVLTHRRLRTITNAFVVSLAVADFLVAILVMPFGIYQQMNNKVWALGHRVCLWTASIDVMFSTASIFNLCCLAIDRYLAICRPFVHERISRTVVIVMLSMCWLIPPFISFLPIQNEWNHIGIEDYVNCLAIITNNQVCSFIVNKVFAILCSLIAFYIPTVFMIVCNIKIYLAARKQAHQIRSLEASLHKHHKGKWKQETKAAKTIGIIMGCFCVFWCPFFILNVIDPLIGFKVPYAIWTPALWLGYINSMMNPFLYYNFNRSFKTAFKRLLTFKVCRGVREYDDDYDLPSAITHSTDLNTHTDLHSNSNKC